MKGDPQSDTDIDVKVTEDRLIIADSMDFVRSPQAGAISSFIGVTRDTFEGKNVVSLEYEAYVPMAVSKLREICTQAMDKWDLLRVSVHHKIGDCPVGVESVVICVSSPHRQDGLKATEYLIDVLKEVVPIWKKEIYDDGTSNWKENCECQWKKKKKRKISTTEGQLNFK
eukprot:Nk52_evm43s32 gene=Nk52_evmTU43s32